MPVLVAGRVQAVERRVLDSGKHKGRVKFLLALEQYAEPVPFICDAREAPDGAPSRENPQTLVANFELSTEAQAGKYDGEAYIRTGIVGKIVALRQEEARRAAA